MPRQPRQSSGTGIYHVMMRGVNCRNIFDDDTRRLKDEEVRELIIQQIGTATVETFLNIDREQQESIIIWLREEGASVRQIVRYTGYTTKQVRTLTDKKLS